MKIIVEHARGSYRFKCIAAAQKIATAFRKGDVGLSVDGETVPDVNQWGD